MDLVGFCGSLRKGSFNRMLMNLVQQSLPQAVRFEEIAWREVPPFDADELTNGFPPPVVLIRERVRRADGVIFVTPEYNFSIPGMLKNTIDWISRGEDQPFAHKPVAILSASTGLLGGARGQYDLRRAMLFVHADALVKPEVFVGQVQNKFDADGVCTDVMTRTFVKAQMDAFVKHVQRVAAIQQASLAS